MEGADAYSGTEIWTISEPSKKKGQEFYVRMSAESGTSQRFQSEQGIEGPLLDISKVLTATGNFSLDNKIGEGGFGPVYKGILSYGQEVAVKKLSSSSKQRLDELKNEVIYVAKLQHRNLVKLLGCCIQKDNLLIYEYMPNGSLDSFLFKEAARLEEVLRHHHRNSERGGLPPPRFKISDFGLARGFTGNKAAANTNSVVGTYGYVSPEYAIHGAFSITLDVFSYGVLVLEIVSGQRNRGFYHPDHQHNLLGHAWKLFAHDGRPLDCLSLRFLGAYMSACFAFSDVRRTG